VINFVKKEGFMSFLPTKEEIDEILKKVKDPESQMSLFELGLVKYIDYREETRTLVVKLDFIRRNPTCVGCLPIAWFVQKKITDDLAKEFLSYKGIEHVEFKL